jgi:hypothetical protein
MGIVVGFAHFAFDAADVVAETSVGTADEPACVCQSLVLEALPLVVFLRGGRAIPFCPILSEDVIDLGIGNLGSVFVVLGEVRKLVSRVFEVRLGL